MTITGSSRQANIRALDDSDRGWVLNFIDRQWGNPVVAHGVVYHPHDLPGFVAIVNGERSGLVTYTIEGDACEIVTLNSLLPGAGIGSALVEAVKRAAINHGCQRLWLITTNDNLPALAFYQKRGFRIAGMNAGAVDESRLLKPSIPEIGLDGIPLRDEIVLEMRLEP